MRRQSTKANRQVQPSDLSLKVLSCCQVQQIDDMLDEMGAFGELRLIKKKGQIRFIESTPDTMVTLLNGDRVMVTEDLAEVVTRAIQYQRQIRVFAQ